MSGRFGIERKREGDCRLKVESHVQSVLSVGVVSLFYAVNLETESVAVQSDSSAVGLPYMK